MDSVKKYLHQDMMKPHGQTVTIVREGTSFPLQLDGRDTPIKEVQKYVGVNPGVLRVFDESNKLIWDHELSQHDDCDGFRICDKGYFG